MGSRATPSTLRLANWGQGDSRMVRFSALRGRVATGLGGPAAICFGCGAATCGGWPGPGWTGWGAATGDLASGFPGAPVFTATGAAGGVADGGSTLARLNTNIAPSP